MTAFTRTFLGSVLIAAVCGALYYWKTSAGTVDSAARPSKEPVALASPSPTIRYPVPTETGPPGGGANTAARKPVPSLEESDPTISMALADLVGKQTFDALFNPSDLVRRIVVTIDSATGAKQPSQEFSPLKSPDSDFGVVNAGEETQIDSSNFKRYNSYVGLIRTIGASRLVNFYLHFYTLFQTAYKDLGTQGYFNDRLVEVIDKCLATPEIKSPIKVIRPTANNKYKFVDEQLENLSAIQKLLVRMGPSNTAAVKEQLRLIRARLVTLGK